MWQTIKNILQKNKDAYIVIVENEKPLAIITGYDVFEKKLDEAGKSKKSESTSQQTAKTQSDELEVYEEVNREIINLQAPSEQPTNKADDDKSEEVTIEDIPIL